jgi:hypothetical protein
MGEEVAAGSRDKRLGLFTVESLLHRELPNLISAIRYPENEQSESKVPAGIDFR